MDYKIWVLVWDFSRKKYWKYPQNIFIKRAIQVDKLWEEHRAVHRERISKLNSDALGQLTKILCKSSISENEAYLISEHIVCEYLKNLEQDKSNARPARLSHELESIYKAAVDLERALRNLSENSTELLFNFLSDDVSPEEKEKCPDPGEIFFDILPDDYHVYKSANPIILFALSELSKASKEILSYIPEDAGGEVSGNYDATGARVRTRLAQTTRVLLRHLGLPCGSQKNGPVSKFMTLVHDAAKFETPAWADRYAELSPGLEKQWQKDEADDEARGKKSIIDHIQEVLDSGVIDNQRSRRDARVDAYLKELRNVAVPPHLREEF